MMIVSGSGTRLYNHDLFGVSAMFGVVTPGGMSVSLKSLFRGVALEKKERGIALRKE